MGTTQYMKSWRTKLFPELTDMTEMEEYEYVKTISKMNPNKLRFKEWFWLHPSAYSLIYYGTNIIAMLFFGAVSYLFLLRGNYIIMIFPSLIFLSAIYDMHRKLRNPVPKGTTFYKMWLSRGEL